MTITIPPGLPMALAIGVVYAQRRLIRKSIFSISPKRINLAGGINLCLFDKTGTLTNDGLYFSGVQMVDSNGQLTDTEDMTDETTIKQAMAACHTVTIIGDKLIGDPLEVEIFTATQWKIEICKSDCGDKLKTKDGWDEARQ